LTDHQVSSEPDARWTALAGHREEVVAKLRHRLGDHPDAEDFVQEALIKVAARADVDPSRAVGLLLTTATRLAIDGHRRQLTEMRAIALLGHQGDSAWPEEQVLGRLAVREIRRHMSELPPREREVFARRANGYGLAEAAAALAVSYKAVDRAYAKARAKLQRAMGAVTSWMGWLVVKRRRIVLGAQGGGVPAAAAIALIVGSVVSATQGRAAPRDAGSDPGGVVTVHLGKRLSLSDALVSSPRERPRSGPTPSVSLGGTPRATSKAAAVVGPVGQPHVVVAGGASVHRERKEEDVSTTLSKCLREGVQLRATYIGCP
jgi:RNA polymerase sigma factor (sigma-70 family)